MLLFLISPDARRLSPRRRTLLIVLRIVVFLAIIAAMLRPTYVFTEMKRNRATVIVLADRSRSMSVADEKDGATRWDTIRKQIDRALPDFKKLGEDLDVKFYTFASDLTPIDFSKGAIDLGKTPDGAETAIGAAMADALRNETGHRVAGVILLSDGGQNAFEPRDMPPQAVARRLNDQSIPLYTITLGGSGSSTQQPDVAVTALEFSPSVYIKNQLTIKGAVRVRGYGQQAIPVQALFEAEPGKPPEVIGAASITAGSEGKDVPVEFDYVPQVTGEHRITLRVPPQPQEQNTANNEMSSFVRVLPGGLNVLYVEGELRVEQRFLRRSLNASPDIKVDFEWLDHRLRKQWPVDFSDRFKPGKYDVYILGDIDSDAFRPDDLTELRKAVEHGAGLLMLGGFHSYWAGGWQDTPLADVLPFESTARDRFDRQRYDEPIRGELNLKPANRSTGIKMLPDERYGNVSVMRLGPPDQNRELWEKLPGLDGANLFHELKPSAKVLAVSPDHTPLLVAAEPGAGRLLAFAGDSTWRWYMHGFEREHKRFWRQAVLWLAKKEDTEKTGVWIKLAQRQFAAHRPVEFTVGAMSPQGEPLEGAKFQAEAVAPDGAHKPIRLSRMGSQSVGTFRDSKAPGEYAIVVSGSQEGAAIGEARARFIVYEQDLEMENPVPRHSLMQSLAAITQPSGGNDFPPEELPKICQLLEAQTNKLEVATETKETPWDKPWFFAFVAAILSAEWYLRKKWGLV